jgi:hypothetical protein
MQLYAGPEHDDLADLSVHGDRASRLDDVEKFGSSGNLKAQKLHVLRRWLQPQNSPVLVGTATVLFGKHIQQSVRTLSDEADSQM